MAEGHRLVRTGPYRFLRHPIYTAVLGMYLGTLLVSGEIHAPLGLLLVLLAYWRKITLKSRPWPAAFGAEREAYRLETWVGSPACADRPRSDRSAIWG